MTYNMGNFLIKNPKLESIVNTLASDFMEKYNTPRCYEIARHFQKELPNHGFSKPAVRNGIAAYDLNFLADSCSDENVKRVLLENKKNFDYINMDHSWCELFKEGVRVDYLPSINLPEGRFEINELLLSNINLQNNEAEYWPIGKEFKVAGQKFIYTPLMGPEIGKFTLPKIIRLHQL